MLERQTQNLRRVAIGAGIYSTAALGLMTWPASGWGAGIMACLYLMRKGKQRLTSMGSARWADRNDLNRAGMLNARSGLILGKVPKTKELIRLPQAVHSSIFAPSGAGKGVSLIIPFLLQSPSCAVIVDFKGELWKETAEHRRKNFGHQIVVLDPFHSVTDKPDTFDPIEAIQKDDPQAIDSCNDLASSLVIKTGEEKEPHWNAAAEMYIAGIAAAVVEFGEKPAKTRSIQMVSGTLANPRQLDSTIQLMMKEGGDALAQKASQLTHFTGDEKGSVLTTVGRHLTFLGSPAVMENTRSTSFDASQLRKGKMTVYLILPPDRAAAQAGLMRMWISSLMRAVVREGLSSTKVDFVIDEAAFLGPMDPIKNALNWGRGYGISLTLVYQCMAQAEICFPHGQHQAALASTCQTFFAVNDNATSDYVSARLGDQTTIIQDGGTNTGSSSGRNEGGRDSSRNAGSSSGSSTNWKQHQRRLLKPEEILAMPRRTAVSFVPGMPPICTTLLRYYEEKWMSKGAQSNVFADVVKYLRAGVTCLILFGVAVALTPGAIRALHVLMGR